MSIFEEELKCNALSENSKISQIFEPCLQPNTKKDLENILKNFLEKIKVFPDQYVGIFDCICLYALDYIYNHDNASFCAVSRTLYLYQMLDQLILKGNDRNLIYNFECLFKALQEFTDLHAYSKKEELLVNVFLGSILNGNLGLARYLIKFGLIEFPSEVNERCQKMFEILVTIFNSCRKTPTGNDIERSVRVDELLNKIKEKNINVRRSILTFCILTITMEYYMYHKLEVNFVDLKFITEHKKDLCLQKLLCMDLYTQATSESAITIEDIEDFIEEFLNPFITAEAGTSLLKISRKKRREEHSYHNPRSLKHFTRLKVRSNLSNSMSIPEQVNKLNIPVTLKEFLKFHSGGLWEHLLINRIYITMGHKINSLASEIEERYRQSIENVNVREVENDNMGIAADGNAQEAADGNAQEAAEGNAHKDIDENV